MLYRSCSTNGILTSLYDVIFVSLPMAGTFLWKQGDGRVIDGFGPERHCRRVLDITRNGGRLQTGYLYHYAFAMLIGCGACHMV